MLELVACFCFIISVLSLLYIAVLFLTYFSRLLYLLEITLTNTGPPNISTVQKILSLCLTLNWIIPPRSCFLIKLTSTSSLNSICYGFSWQSCGIVNFRPIMFGFYVVSCKGGIQHVCPSESCVSLHGIVSTQSTAHLILICIIFPYRIVMALLKIFSLLLES